jgi:predicted nucleic acid-binding protein
MAFWDTSALLKLYLAEADSPRFEALALESGELVTAFIGKYEARTSFRRKEAQGVIPTGEADVCWQRFCADIQGGRIRLVPESSATENEFGRILDQCLSQAPPVFVRTNDALHLAAAKIAAAVEFVTADARQRAAATLLGFKVHP